MSLIPSSGRGALGRFTIAAGIVIAFTAATTAVAGLLQFKQFAKEISGTVAIKHAPVTIPQPGDPQTLLIIGSDHRAHQAQSAANSDTMILVRLNPSSSTINVMSVPRDLQVNIPLPGGGVQRAKMNASYPLGGPSLVVKTLQSAVFPRLKVNHIVDINFAGFRDLVDAMGCVYTDVDRRYFNQNLGTAATNYSNINLQAGYQKLCGEDALSYVRYRHTDTDIVRSARQQDFIRDAKAQYGQARLISNRDKLLTIFGKHTQTDADLHTTDGLINLFNLVAFADGHAIREVHFPAVLQPCPPPAPCFVTADPAAEVHAYQEFMAQVGPGSAKAPSASHPASRARSAAPTPTAGLKPDLAEGKLQASALTAHGLPVEVPKQIVASTHYAGPTAGEYPRAYTIHDPGGAPHAAYRIVLSFDAALGQFYGIQGTTWQSAPILASASEIRYVGGRRLELHFDGRKLRLVAWRTAKAVYWVSNTLSLDLTNQQMLGVAASLTRA